MLVVLLSSLALAACGEEATPAPPTPTPQPRFQQVNSPNLFFTMNVPFGWTKNDVDSTSVVFTDPANPNLGVGVVSRQVGKLTPDSRRIVEERIDQLKTRFPQLKQDINGGGSLTLVDTTISVDRLSYTSNGQDLVQYITEANNVKAQRAYILFGVTPAKDADTYRPLYIEAFKSFISTATDAPVIESGSGVADPTVQAANLGGKVRPVSGREQRGKILRLVEWETPPLNASLKTPRISGFFPYDFGWRLRPFPSPTNPAVYLDSPVVDRATNQAVIQIGVVRDALPSNNPTPDEWKKFYSPVLSSLFDKTISSYAFPWNVTLGDVAQAGSLYRVPFTARDDRGEVQSRGVVLFSKSSTHGVISMVSLSPVASLKQELVDSFDADLQTMANSFQVKF